MKLVSAIPLLPVRSVADAVGFYRDVLGFTVTHRDGGFAIMQRDVVEMHLGQADDERWRERGGETPVVSGSESFLAGTASCRIEMQGVDELHMILEPRGVLHPNGPLRDKPWGTREFATLDPDGNLITFFERTR